MAGARAVAVVVVVMVVEGGREGGGRGGGGMLRNVQVVCTLQLSGAGPASGETRGWLEGTRGVDPECEEAEDCA